MERQKIGHHYRISVIGNGNLAYRLSIVLKTNGHNLEYICGRDLEKASKLAYILNKPEYSALSTTKTVATINKEDVADSEIVVLAVPDNSIEHIAKELYNCTSDKVNNPVVLHCSGAASIQLLEPFPQHGVLYPLMTLSVTKPVDFSIIPFFLESNSQYVADILTNICYSVNSEYKFASSEERAKLHLAAVYVSNFVNYLTGLSYELSAPNHMFLMPLAIETIRKAFLYGHPSLVQTGPAVRGDSATIGKHLALLAGHPEHREVYEMLTKMIITKKNI
ncbi:MAG: DUF2520 domain-containing protein [Bacteroidia bacterium]|nr:DUF2520 domain-containing protein [Bacteroidia bacterium]